MNLTRNDATLEWGCESIVATGTYNGSSVDATFDCGEVSSDPKHISTELNTIVAPFQYSFACYKIQLTSSPNNTYVLELDDLQVGFPNENIQDIYCVVIPVLRKILKHIGVLVFL